MRRVYTVEVNGLPDDIEDVSVRQVLAAAVSNLHRLNAPEGTGLSVGTSGGFVAEVVR